jgi:hypothetical protein
MPLDSMEKKLCAQFDDPAQGQRATAFEMFRERRLKKKPPETFVDLLAEMDSAVPRAQYEAAMQANASLSAKYHAALMQLGVLKGVLAIKLYWQSALAVLALPVIGLVGYYFYSAAQAAQVAEIDAGFSRIAASSSWAQISDSDAHPIIRLVNDVAYWVIWRRDQNRLHVNADDTPVTVQCVRVFATPAEEDAGVYREPHPYALWGWGWLTWSQRASDCRSEAARQSDHPLKFNPSK